MKAVNGILILLMAAVFCVLLLSYIRKFSVGDTCCGTEKVKVKRKKLKRIAGTITLHVEGMHCENCRKTIMEAVNDMPGHAAAVDLPAKTCKVSYETVPDVEEVIRRIRAAGFDAYME